MKYPKSQFTKLKAILSKLNEVYTNLDFVHPAKLHYIAYQQVSDGQINNRLVNCEGVIINQWAVEGKEFAPICQIDTEFELYPNGCNDKHVVTATKKALKEIQSN